MSENKKQDEVIEKVAKLLNRNYWKEDKNQFIIKDEPFDTFIVIKNSKAVVYSPRGVYSDVSLTVLNLKKVLSGEWNASAKLPKVFYPFLEGLDTEMKVYTGRTIIARKSGRTYYIIPAEKQLFVMAGPSEGSMITEKYVFNVNDEDDLFSLLASVVTAINHNDIISFVKTRTNGPIA